MNFERAHRALWAASTLAIASLSGGVAHAQSDKDAEAAAQESAGNERDIIVTAGKREELLRDVAGGISAFSGEQLEQMGAQEFKDYMTRAPGVAFNEGPPQNSTVVIRGVGTTAGLDQGQGTTGYFINDVPMAEPGYTVIIPDIDAFDIDRVEVLRGPQGSRFGSASLGGAINYISNLADSTKFDAGAELGVTSTRFNSGELGYRAKGMINVPIVNDVLAVRLTATQRVDAGYIDNVGTGIEGANDIHNLGLRGSIVFTPASGTKLTYLGLYYRTKADDNSYAQLAVGPLARKTAFPTTERYSVQIHSLRLDQEIGDYTLTALGAWNEKTGDLRADYTPYYGYINPGAVHVFQQLGNSETKSIEVRLASPSGRMFDFMIGGTYIDTDKYFEEHLTSPGLATARPDLIAAGRAIGDEYYFGRGDTLGTEKALFGEANLHLGKFTLTAGGRWFDTRQFRKGAQYLYFFPTPNIQAGVRVQESGFAPRLAAKYEFSKDAMVYGVVAKGFRFGAPNLGLIPLAGFDTPEFMTSDSLWSYEIGTRFGLADNKLLIDLTAFYIDWKNLQVRLVRPDDFTYGANAGAAEIKGVEATLSYRSGGLSLSSNLTYLDAKISEGFIVGITSIVEGTTLPSSAKWRINNSASYDFGGDLRPTITLAHRYVSKARSYLNTPGTFPAFHAFDLRGSVKVTDQVDVSAFVNNLTDRRAVTFGYGSGILGVQQFYIRPRTFGLSVSWGM